MKSISGVMMHSCSLKTASMVVMVGMISHSCVFCGLLDIPPAGPGSVSAAALTSSRAASLASLVSVT